MPLHPNNGPHLTADVIIELESGGIVLIERKNEPPGWAIPGGFVERNESLETAATREAKEETGLDVELGCLLHVYSTPERDPRGHTVTAVFTGKAAGVPIAADDAKNAVVVYEESLPSPLAFDHAQVLADYFRFCRTGKRPSDP